MLVPAHGEGNERAQWVLKPNGLVVPRRSVRPLHQSEVHSDRIPSTTPGAEPPRDAKDSGSARSHSTHLETSSSDRP